MLSDDVQRSARECVLCWLATSSADGQASVSPKEIFAVFEGDSIVIANIASPQSARNIRENPLACVSFVNVFSQRGYQVKGAAAELRAGDDRFEDIERLLLGMTMGKFPFKSVFRVMGEDIREIIAPRYRLFPETTEQEQIENAMDTYGVQPRE